MSLSSIFTTAPATLNQPIQKLVYPFFAQHHIAFQRVATDPVITIADCQAVDAKLQMAMVKTLLLTNHQQSQFYLYVLPGAQKFNTKAFSQALAIPRVSFAPKALLQAKLNTDLGATTIFSLLQPDCQNVQLVVDQHIFDTDSYGCSDGTTTNYLKLTMTDLKNTILPQLQPSYQVIASD